MKYTIEQTFESHADGSGAYALLTLSRAAGSKKISFSYASKCSARWIIVGAPSGEGNILSGRAGSYARAEIEEGMREFCSLVDALGPEWKKKNRELYAESAEETVSTYDRKEAIRAALESDAYQFNVSRFTA